MKKYFSSRLLAITMAFFVIGVIGMSAWLYEHMLELAGEYYQVVRNSYVALYDAERMEKTVIDMETGLRGYLLTGDPAFLEPYSEARQEMQKHYKGLYKILKQDTASLACLESINYEVQGWISRVAEPEMAKRKLVGQDATLKTVTAGIDFPLSKAIMDHIRSDFDKLDNNLEVYRTKQIQNLLTLQRHIALQNLMATMALLVIIIFLGLVLYHRTRQVERQNVQLLNKEERLQKAVRELYMASKMKSEFLANMSHELRTPLNAIIGFAQVLQKQYYGPLSEKQSKYIEYILTSGQHLLSLINDVLDLSKIEAGKLELEPATFSLKKLLENSMIMVKEKAARHRIELNLQVDQAIPELIADERKVKQIVFNLLSNAVKFTPDGGKITVRARLLKGGPAPGEKDMVEISVADTGIGIAPEDQEKIFEAFVQVDNSYTRQYEGTGLGLTLVHRLVELHGGKVWVESTGPGRGSTFYFTLPLRVETKEQQ